MTTSTTTPTQDMGICGECGQTKRMNIHGLLKCEYEYVFEGQYYCRFIEADRDQVEELLKRLPPANLDDHQNYSPALKELMQACVQGDGKVWLSGYVIGAGRSDERVIVDTVKALICGIPDALWERYSGTDGATAETRKVLWEYFASALGIVATPDNVPDIVGIEPMYETNADYCEVVLWWD